ncbi:hypothetical protein M569_12918, partial [Genlisea aurea]
PFLPKTTPSALATNIIVSYFEAGLVGEARNLFDEMSGRDVIAWSAMISGYSSRNMPEQSWSTFLEMMRDGGGGGVRPNEFTFSGVLRACRAMNCYSLSRGASVHGMAAKCGVLGNIYIANCLMDLYGSRRDSVHRAVAVFEEMEFKTRVSWTTLMASFTHLGDGHGALQFFRKFLLWEAELNPFIISIAIRASSSTGWRLYGEQIHGAVCKKGFESDVPVMNSLLDMYSRCSSSMAEAERCFQAMASSRDIISCNTMIASYQKSDPYRSLSLFRSLELAPTPFTFTSAVAAAATAAAFGVGEQVHGSAVRRGMESDVGVANALIDMYAKCGSIGRSRRVFEETEGKNLVSYTSMMAGYGSHGRGREAIRLFDRMIGSGMEPDRVVFVAALNACSHAGLVEEGLQLFDSMIGAHGIQPDREIYGCVVDLLGRAGRIEEAYETIERMPMAADESIWGAYLGACKAHRVVPAEAASRRAKKAAGIWGTYSALSNLYAGDGNWGEFRRMRRLMRGLRKKKEAGRSCIEVKNRVFSFVAMDRMAAEVDEIEAVYEVVHSLLLHMR